MLGACWLLARVLAHSLPDAGWVLAVCLILACLVLDACWVLVDAGITAGLLANL